ncbi:tetratricopeptide repeat-containing sensor histidine kinase [Flavobacterium panacagri]|uniref:tetratricopeptide repeat-containing sensor histidine kinase n=1 Tax=Flavobacterium panacagri TaxID=3034146 RepID=UPI0025A64BA0|nr:histidine kinase dimerization/phosphoacceptor domain -containing protein [Flavobacterium panacagri]
MKAFHFLIFFIVISFQGQSQGKLNKVSYNIDKQRLLIKSTAMYLSSVSQGTIDIDSAMVLACTANKLPVSFSFDENYNDDEGESQRAIKMVDQNNIPAALKLLPKLEKTEQIKLFLHLGSYYLFMPGEKKHDLKISLSYIKQAIDLSNSLGILKWKLQSNTLLAKYYTQADNASESKRLFSKVVNENRILKDPKSLADILNNQGTYLAINDPDKEKILTEAMSIYKSLHQKELEIEVLMKILTIHFWAGNIDLAEKELLKALELQKQIGFLHTHYTTAPLAYIYTIKNDLKKALVYAIEGTKTMEGTNDLICADNFYLRLGSVYSALEHNEEAINLFKKSFNKRTKGINSGSWYKSLYLIIQTLCLEKKYKEALHYIALTDNYPPTNTLDSYYLSYAKATSYEEMKNYAKAEKFYIEMDKYAQMIITPKTVISILFGYTKMSLFYAKKGNALKAAIYADKVASLAEKMNHTVKFQELELALFKIDSINGNYASSMKHYQNFTKIHDSLYDIAKNRKIEELKIQYETLKKEESINTLEVKSKLQETELDKSKLLINFSIGIILLLFIIIGLFYNHYQLKQKNNKKLELKEKEISLKNKSLQNLVLEKEWLIKEIHHRVKNNLQTVMSLLNSQTEFIEDDLALSTIKSSQLRIHAMSLIHQKLYMSENIASINMPIYINELVEYLRDSFHSNQHIRFVIDIEELELEVTQAIPVGLIINEAVTNALKYAFPDNRDGIISLSLISTESDQYTLTVKDNGIGIPINDNKVKTSFGMSLIKGLCEDLDAVFSIENNNGTVIQLTFEKNILDVQEISSDEL